MQSSKLTEKEFDKIYRESLKYKCVVSFYYAPRSLYEKVQYIKNAPWYVKLWWKIKFGFLDLIGYEY